MIRLALRIAFAAFLFSVLAGFASAALISVVSMEGNWRDPVDNMAGTQVFDPAITNGVPTSFVVWGDGPTQSGYVFTRSIPSNQVLPPAPTPFFPMGTFTHGNHPVNSPSLVSIKLDIVLMIDVDGVPSGPHTFTFDFTHTETPNNQSPCPYPTPAGEGCTDRVSFVQGPAPATFMVNGTAYTLAMAFRDINGLPVSQFITREARDNSATLIGQFTLPPTASCGNNICDGTDTCSNCSQDCGFCAPPAPTPSVQFNASSYNAAENDGLATITVTRTLNTTSTSTVNYATSNGTAQAGSDYTSTSGVLTFNAGEATKTFQIPVLTDFLSENTETVQLTLTNPTNATLGLSQAVLNITNSAAPQSQIQFGSASYTENESAAFASITVVRTISTNGSASIRYEATDGSAIDGQHYHAVSGTLSFADGEANKTFQVPVINNGLADGNKTVNLGLSSPSGAVLGTPSNAVLTIVDAGAAPPSPTPFINEIVPFSAPVNWASSFPLRIVGQNFNTTSAEVLWDGGTSLPVVSRSATEITATLSPALWGGLSGTHQVRVRNPGNLNSNSAAFTVFPLNSGNPPPFVVRDPLANPNPTFSATTNVSVLGGTFNPGGEAVLLYEWQTVGLQPGGISFSGNNSNAAKNATATLTAPGTYRVRVKITDSVSGFSVMTNHLDIVAIARETTLTLTPKAQTITPDLTPVLRATVRDQFGNAMNLPLNWTNSAGSLSVNQTQATLSVDATIRQVHITASTLNNSLSDSANVVVVFGSGGVGSLAQATVGPVPFKSTSGLPGVTFRQLNPGTKIRLFTANGNHVQTLQSGGNTEVLWDLTNTGRSRVSSGVYLFIMENGDQKREGKVVLIL